MLGEQSRQPGASALSDLAVLRLRPSVLATELLATGIARELTFKDQSLIGRKLTREATDQPEVVPQQSETLDVDASVCRLHPTLPRPERQREGHRGLDRAASAEGTAAILNAREEALLERVGDVRTARERVARGPLEQLDRGLAVAVLQILPGKPVSMCRKQQLASRADHQRNRLGRIEQACDRPLAASRLKDSCRVDT